MGGRSERAVGRLKASPTSAAAAWRLPGLQTYSRPLQGAKLEIEVCAHDDFMLTTARSLVNAAVEAHMRLHNSDRQAAQSWIREAAA